MRCALLLLACLALPAWAQERILRHDVDVRVLADGRLDVTERIELRAEGRTFRHGLVRDLPVRDRDPYGDVVVTDLEMQDVLRDGRVEPWRIERVGRVLRLRTGDAGHLKVPSQPVYTLHYRTTRQPLFGDTRDALSLDAIGSDQSVPVEQGSVTVTLPRAVAVDTLRAEGITGATGRDFHVSLSAAGTARWTLTQALQPHTGLHVRLAFPKDVIAAPTSRQRALWWLQDNAGLLVALVGLLVLAAYCVLRWRRVRHPQTPGAAPERHEPPTGFSPAGLRYLRRMRYDARSFAADLLASAVDDHLCLHRTPQGARTGWRIERTHAGAHTLPTMEQRAQLTALLPEPDDAVDLRSREQARVAQACKAHELALRKRFVPALFRAHGGSILGALAIALAASVPALWLAWHSPSLPATVLVVILMAPMLLGFALLVRAPTTEGRQLLAHAEGLRRHLAGGAKAGRRHGDAPAMSTLDAARYVRLLPYAVALDVEDAWTKAFAATVGDDKAIEAVAGIAWYRGLVVTDLVRFSRSMGDSLAARIAAVASPNKKKKNVPEPTPPAEPPQPSR
ncbi:DUF2207 domain-containing protein [Luteimonas fraxinea]|uniref:DUF2207 domain-containing protein n=1 Tax=Luteimonas fraxinea TaxID=2901869 RepID=A0ABS8UBH3_9GAMM|nr:DUF2207 domain-containing protein [Luteimonas fraxinea]MCD9096094.1 DUF2207 domain-containing protein [Luteimonas fraxinea]MCD9124684.1 DUF2207 domain-containing protein [Luteimonas fraxinea]UHH10736.1 DUF2207 domain-containing protein [Luteimonas fraxinea]